MARKIIVLERPDKGHSGRGIEVRVAFWLDVPVSRQPYVTDRQAGVSAVDMGPDRATTAELTALDNGNVTEIVEMVRFPPGTAVPTIKTGLIARYNELQAQVNSDNEIANYGTSWDGTIWTNKVIA